LAFPARYIPAGFLFAACLAACGGGGESDEATATATANGPSQPANGELLVAFVASPDQPDAQPDAVRLVNLATGDKRDIGEVARYSDVAFSPDGAMLATVIEDGDGATIRVYDVESGEMVPGELEVDELAGMRWSPNGAYLAVVAREALTFVTRAGEARTHEGVGATSDANPLQWTWSRDGSVFGVVLEPGLSLVPVDGGAATFLPRAEFPDPGATWVLRTGEEPREFGLVDLAPLNSLPEGRAEYPVTVSGGQLVPGEPRIVSIYDWGTLPSQAFDAATSQQFPVVRKTCDPCRTADGSSSVLVFWLPAANEPTPGPDVTAWPEGTGTYLALESTVESAVAVDLGIQPTGEIDIEAWQPVYDVVRVE
jgi:hypothetical protein